jgi:glycosyltransferase involved in cell wall biosynthesis
LVAPARVIDIHLDRRLNQPEVIDVSGYESVWCLTRLSGIPNEISFWNVADDDKLSVSPLLEQLGGSLGQFGDGKEDAGILTSPNIGSGSEISLTVVICTRDRPQALRRALESLQAQSDSGFATLVVDNAPSTAAAAGVVDELGWGSCRYVIESQSGLSRARNRALREASTDFIAWIDDDELADPDWVRRIKEGFDHPARPAAVCGLMFPAELETEAQVRFEQYGGFNKGRDINSEVLTAGSPGVPHTLYPLPAIGSGGNMAFSVEDLHSVGAFDPCLGAGTKTHGGDETRVFCSLLRSGRAVLHWPPAITWHFHRHDMAALHRQFYGYSAGLSAFYASMLMSEPGVVTELLRLAPKSRRERLAPTEDQVTKLPADFPRSLRRAARRGLFEGAFWYCYERLRSRGA